MFGSMGRVGELLNTLSITELRLVGLIALHGDGLLSGEGSGHFY